MLDFLRLFKEATYVILYHKNTLKQNNIVYIPILPPRICHLDQNFLLSFWGKIERKMANDLSFPPTR